MSNRIKELRKQANLSQEQLGELIGCNKSKISKLENESQELTQSWMSKIARALSLHGAHIMPADLLPDHLRFESDLEKDCTTIIRALQDSQIEEFRAMIGRFER